MAKLLTNSVMTKVYSTMMNKNLKKWAASCASPAIQYVLSSKFFVMSNDRMKGRIDTHIVDTAMVGTIRKGMTSKRNRVTSHAVGL